MLKNLMKICLWLLAFVPLIVDNSVFYPETSGKNLLIQISLVLFGVLFSSYFIYERNFREETLEKTKRYFKNPLVISIFCFLFIFIVSTIFAGDKYGAFWGNIERAEGLVNMIFLFIFFIFSLLIFERKDWLCFFKLSLFTAGILLFKEFADVVNGLKRSGSFIGNPTFLAGYLLFSICSAFIVFTSTIKFGAVKAHVVSLSQISWRFFSAVIIALSIIGIFVTETRGTILGLGSGIVAVLTYCVFNGKDIICKRLNLRKVSVILLCSIIILSLFFIFTRKSEMWQKIPGLSRVAKTEIGLQGDSAISRLFTIETSLRAVNPITNGWVKALIGWGPDNFIIAYSKYYDANQYKYETKWFDRAHNKLLDVLVMNGLLGLIAYLSIWLFFFWLIFKKSILLSFEEVKNHFLYNLGFLFFGVSFIVHLLFIFDHISTSLPFFAIFSFIVYLSIENMATKESKMTYTNLKFKNSGIVPLGIFLVSVSVFLGFIFLKNTLPAYFQMRSYFQLIKDPVPLVIKNNLDPILAPFTNAQMDIRRVLLLVSSDIYNKKVDKDSVNLLDKAFKDGEYYIDKRPLDFRFLSSLADVYSHIGQSSNNNEYLKKGEALYMKMLNYAPNRPDVIYGLAINLLLQQKFIEAFDYFEKSFSSDQFISDKNRNQFEVVYTRLIKYFYNLRDKDNFIKTANRLKKNNYIDSDSLDQIIIYLEKNKIWPKVNFE